MKNLIVFVSLWLSACAFSPQQLTIKPELDRAIESYGGGRTLSVLVEDLRVDKALGTRGGVYENTSVITLANNLETAIATVAMERLAEEGFVVSSGQSDVGSATVKIIIHSLNYDVPKDSMVKKVFLVAALSVEASHGDTKYIGQYKTESEHPTIITPTMKKNERMVNDVLSDTLIRLFNDRKLKAFLSNS